MKMMHYLKYDKLDLAPSASEVQMLYIFPVLDTYLLYIIPTNCTIMKSKVYAVGYSFVAYIPLHASA